MWEWVDTRQQRQSEQERLQREAARERRKMREEAAASARTLESRSAGGEAQTPADSQGCVLHVNEAGEYCVVCRGDAAANDAAADDAATDDAS